MTTVKPNASDKERLYISRNITATREAYGIKTADESFTNGGTFTYSKGSARYNWVAARIDDARTAGIPWVVVSMQRDWATIFSR